MGDPLWTFDQLARLTRFEDAEVRFWAAERLVRLHARRAPEVLGGLLFDDHDSTPGLVAGHLGSHGRSAHFPILIRGFRRGSGSLAGHCLEALARLGSAEAPGLAREAVHRRDMGEETLGRIVDGLCWMAEPGEDPERPAGLPRSPRPSEPAREEAADAAREILMRRTELFADPAVLKACFRIFGDHQTGDLASRWVTALHFRGLDGADAGMRAFQDRLQLEEVSWCLRTGRDGRVDLNRSLRAIENGYDCEVRSQLSDEERGDLAQAFGRGEFRAIVEGLTGLVSRKAEELRASRPAADRLPTMLASLADGLRHPSTLEEAEQLGHNFHAWLVALLLSALVKTLGYRNLAMEMEEADGELDALLDLAEVESSSLVRHLPGRMARAAGGDGRDRLEQWCISTLDSRGPFFPKVVALETLGELKVAGHLPAILEYIADDNGYIYGAAERALLNMADESVETIRAELETRKLHPDAMHSVLHVLTEIMTPGALALVLDYFDEFMETAGPEEGAELMSLFGAREMIPALRRHLQRAAGVPPRLETQARIGHALLLLGAIHNIAIPEEERILQTIDEYWKEGTEGPTGGTGSSGGGPWVM